MKICLIHIGPQLPSYFYDCVKQIRRYFNGQIYVAFNSDLRTDDVMKYNLIHCPMDKYLSRDRVIEFDKSCNGFSDFNNDSFWNLTYKRLFVLEEVIKDFNLTNVIHIENDILIYQNPEDIKFEEVYPNKVAVNPVGPKYATYAYCYIPDHESITKLNNRNIELLKEGYKALLDRYDEKMVNEMMILKQILDEGVYVDSLPILPKGNLSKYFDKLYLIFDGASLGQWEFGTADKIPHWWGNHHYVGRELGAGNYEIIWILNAKGFKEPYLRDREGNGYKICNLHIHSKQLELGV